jgi:hypothetical protein
MLPFASGRNRSLNVPQCADPIVCPPASDHREIDEADDTKKKLGNVFEVACVPERVTRSSRVSPLEVKLAAMASTEKPVSMMFLLTLDARETMLSRRPRETGTDGPPVWFWEKT